MWNARRERRLPSALVRGRPAESEKARPSGQPRAAPAAPVKGRRGPALKPTGTGPRAAQPTFTGAQSWVQRHSADIQTAVRLLDLYPNLIQAEGLDPLWDYLQPLLLHHHHRGVKTEGKTEQEPAAAREAGRRERRKTRGRSRASGPGHWAASCRASPGREAGYVYVCDNLPSTEHSTPGKLTRDRIVAALSAHCYVRTSPELPASKSDFSEVGNAVSAADVFLFLLNDASLRSCFCLHQLGIALAHRVPVVGVREAGYGLPARFSPDPDQQLDIASDFPCRVHSIVPSPRRQQQQQQQQQVLPSGRSKSSETRLEQQTRAKSESQSSGFHSDPELPAGRQRTPGTAVDSGRLLSDEVRLCFQTSVLYVPDFHDSCIAKLCARLSLHLGDVFASETARSNAEDCQSTDSEASDRLLPNIRPNGGGLYGHGPGTQRGVDDCRPGRSPSSDGSHEPPDTPTSTEKSVGSPASTSPFVKLPPISGTRNGAGSEGTPVPGDDAPLRGGSPQQEMEDCKTDAMTSMSDFSGLYPSPPSSPFLETRYLVFPDDPKGPSKPYLVSFPADVCGKEDSGASPHPQGRGEDWVDEIRIFNMDEDESGFEKVQLDLRVEDEATEERSPFSSPVPSARRARVPKMKTEDPTPRGKWTRAAMGASKAPPAAVPPAKATAATAAKTPKTRPAQNGKVRGPAQATSEQRGSKQARARAAPPAKKQPRNGPETHAASSPPPPQTNPKKNVKMTKVTLQYGPKGKLTNSLV